MSLGITEQFPIGTAVAIVRGKQAKRGEVEGKVKQYRPSKLRRVEGSQDE